MVKPCGVEAHSWSKHEWSKHSWSKQEWPAADRGGRDARPTRRRGGVDGGVGVGVEGGGHQQQAWPQKKGSNAGQMLDKYWSNTDQILVKFWTNTDQILVKYWVNTGQTPGTHKL